MRSGAVLVAALLLGCGSRSLPQNGTGTGGDGRGGTGGNAGDGVAGSGMGRGGVSGAGGASGVGGSAGDACAQLRALDRSCVTDSDCVAIEYLSSCCGRLLWTGVPKSAASTATSLFGACSSSYPLCLCADPSITTDDGSTVAIAFPPKTISAVAVTCQAGSCETYAEICGHPCASGTSCLDCANPATDATIAICTYVCPEAGS
jgi:hypothetical protein